MRESSAFGFMKWIPLKSAFKACLLGGILSAAFHAEALAQIYVVTQTGNLGEYSLSGEAINPSLYSGFQHPYAMVADSSGIFVGDFGTQTVTKVSFDGSLQLSFPVAGGVGLALYGEQLYVANANDNTISVYNATTGALISGSFITTGISGPRNMTFDQSGNLYVANAGTSSISKFNGVTGELISDSFITGITTPFGLTIDDDILYVSDFAFTGSKVTRHQLSDGSLIGTPITVPDTTGATGISVHDDLLYIAWYSTDNISVVNALDGTLVENRLISGVGNPLGVIAIPEPGSIALLALASVPLLLRFTRKKKTA